MKQNRMIAFAIFGVLILFILFMVSQMLDKKPTVLDSKNSSSFASGSSNPTTQVATQSQIEAKAQTSRSTVPWDYKIEEVKVGDLIGGDMVIPPNNQLLPNDENYATGDQIWVLSYMNAEMITGRDGRNEVNLSVWKPIKSFKTSDEAQKDLDNLKSEIKTEVDLIGVYKTENQGKFRHFAVITLPTGHKIKQPISEERYSAFKNKKQAKVVLEEVHDYTNYDLAMSKFRGWNE